MKHMLRLTDYTKSQIREIFSIADDVKNNKYDGFLKNKTVVMFFPDNSIRTRLSFEKGIYLLGGQSVLFPPETLDKKEDICDVAGYLNNWADVVVVRHKDIALVVKLAAHSAVPVINALTSTNHPCEMITDLYALCKLGRDIENEKYLFCGAKGNIGNTWKEASEVFGFELEQCCPKGFEVEGLRTYDNISDAVVGKDIICTDALPAAAAAAFGKCCVTKQAMQKANKGAILDPCPPFLRGEEVSADVIDSEFFVGYDFKKALLEVQQAIIIYCLTR